MNSETVVYCVVALLLGMLLANMLKNVCGCKVVEGASSILKPCTYSKGGVIKCTGCGACASKSCTSNEDCPEGTECLMTMGLDHSNISRCAIDGNIRKFI